MTPQPPRNPGEPHPVTELVWRDECDPAEHLNWVLIFAVSDTAKDAGDGQPPTGLAEIAQMTDAVVSCPRASAADADAHLAALDEPARTLLAPLRARLAGVDGPCPCRSARWSRLTRDLRHLLDETGAEYWLLDDENGVPVGEMREPGDLTSVLWTAFKVALGDDAFPAELTFTWDGSILAVTCDPGPAHRDMTAGRPSRALFRPLTDAESSLSWSLVDPVTDGVGHTPAREVAALPAGLADVAAGLLASQPAPTRRTTVAGVVHVTTLAQDFEHVRARRVVDDLLATHARVTPAQWSVLVALCRDGWAGTLEDLAATATAVESAGQSV